MLRTVWEREISGEPMSVRILIVDDNATIRDGLRFLLGRAAARPPGYWVVIQKRSNGVRVNPSPRLIPSQQISSNETPGPE
jgi:hypothetical protein